MDCILKISSTESVFCETLLNTFQTNEILITEQLIIIHKCTLTHNNEGTNKSYIISDIV